MANKYRLYIAAPHYKSQYRPQKLVGCENIGWMQVVSGDGYMDALEKCLPEIRGELPKLLGKYVSIYIGKNGSSSTAASRLWPVQVVIETGEIRETHLTKSYLQGQGRQRG